MLVSVPDQGRAASDDFSRTARPSIMPRPCRVWRMVRRYGAIRSARKSAVGRWKPQAFGYSWLDFDSNVYVLIAIVASISVTLFLQKPGFLAQMR